jgi:hypothetical protein
MAGRGHIGSLWDVDEGSQQVGGFAERVHALLTSSQRAEQDIPANVSLEMSAILAAMHGAEVLPDSDTSRRVSDSLRSLLDIFHGTSHNTNRVIIILLASRPSRVRQ